MDRRLAPLGDRSIRQVYKGQHRTVVSAEERVTIRTRDAQITHIVKVKPLPRKY